MTMVANRKEILRKHLLEKLLSLTQAEIKRRSKNVEQSIYNWFLYKKSKVIMVYYPLKGEVNFLGMIRKVLGKKEVCFPVVDLKNSKLIPYKIKDLESDFVTGPYGIKEPSTDRAEECLSDDIDIVFIPGLAFDVSRNRLGRGKGFYDRFIRTLGGRTKTVGVAFDFQIIKDLPVSIPQDQRLDFIVTEHEIF